MIEFLTYFAMFSAAVFLIWILMFIYGRNTKKNAGKTPEKKLKTQKTENGGTDFVRCPLCNTPLAYGEDMTSRVFRPMDCPDQRMIVLGCPHCYPTTERGIKRICPVCRKEVPQEGYLIARLFNRTAVKKHVMVTGCTECYGPKK